MSTRLLMGAIAACLLMATACAGNFSIQFNVTNNQNVPAPAGFQQMVQLNMQTYSNNLTSTLSNVRFYEGSNELYSWCESNCFVGAGAPAPGQGGATGGAPSNPSNTIFWIVLPNGIAAHSTLSLNMTFLPTNTQYDAYAGEAPQFSLNYGQFDNGNTVFPILYQNFTGSASCTVVWYCTGNYSINNGITVTPGGEVQTAGQNGYQYPTTNVVLDFYSQFANGNGINANPQIVYVPYGHPSVITGFLGNTNEFDPCPAFSTCPYATSTFDDLGSPYASNDAWAAYSVYTDPLTNDDAFMVNYSGTAEMYHGMAYSSEEIEMFETIKGTGYVTTQWIRIRDLPPNGVMPAVSFAIPVTTTTTTSSTTTSTSSTTSSTSAPTTTVGDFGVEGSSGGLAPATSTIATTVATTVPTTSVSSSVSTSSSVPSTSTAASTTASVSTVATTTVAPTPPAASAGSLTGIWQVIMSFFQSLLIGK